MEIKEESKTVILPPNFSSLPISERRKILNQLREERALLQEQNSTDNLPPPYFTEN